MALTAYDVCIIGSGAAGGVMAKELCEGGAKVLLLEAGQKVSPGQFLSHTWPYNLPYRGLRGEMQALFYPPDIARVKYEDSDPVRVDRIRVLGGRTLHWNAVTLRYAPQDFRATREGLDEDWPLSYEELEPYYDRIERIIGVCGEDDHLAILPAGRHYLPPIPWRCSEHLLQRATRAMGIPLISVRKAVLTRPYDNRPPCHYCGHCMTGCDVSAIFTSPDCMLPKAHATGNFTLRQNAIARELLVNRAGMVNGVVWVDRLKGQEQVARARIFVLCAATVESARLLLNSRSPQFPDGLANGNGIVGHYLHGHSGGTLYIYLRELEGAKPFNQDGATDHVYIPRYNQLTGPRAYAGGWGIQVNFASYMYPFQANQIHGYGAAYKQRVRELQPGFLHLGSFGRILARPENYVSVDPRQRDEFGIPIPVVHFRFSENDYALWNDLKRSMLEIAGNLRGVTFPQFNRTPGGFASHEVGTIRMGRDAKTSVLNSYCQAREVKNLFVTDGSCFTSCSEKNPTLTIMALSLRAADYIRQQRRRGEL